MQVSSVANHGVDIEAFQRVLSTGQSILCEVDVGVSEAQRGAFLSALSVAKRALIPCPYAVLAMGDVRNRRGSAGDEYLVNRHSWNTNKIFTHVSVYLR